MHMGTFLLAASEWMSLIESRVCVMFVTFFDTCMVSLAALIVWRINPLVREHRGVENSLFKPVSRVNTLAPETFTR